jgi:hypothetical protein
MTAYVPAALTNGDRMSTDPDTAPTGSFEAPSRQHLIDRLHRDRDHSRSYKEDCWVCALAQHSTVLDNIPVNQQELRDLRECLGRIVDVHVKRVDEHGGTWGECQECEQPWPCLTWRIASNEDTTDKGRRSGDV